MSGQRMSTLCCVCVLFFPLFLYVAIFAMHFGKQRQEFPYKETFAHIISFNVVAYTNVLHVFGVWTVAQALICTHQDGKEAHLISSITHKNQNKTRRNYRSSKQIEFVQMFGVHFKRHRLILDVFFRFRYYTMRMKTWIGSANKNIDIMRIMCWQYCHLLAYNVSNVCDRPKIAPLEIV